MDDPVFEARFSADLGRSGSAFGPPGHDEIERIRDVLVISGDPETDKGDASELIMLPRWTGDNAFRGEWAEPDPLDLGHGLRVERLDGDQAERILTACSPRGHFFVPVRQFGQMYSLVVDLDPELGYDAPPWNSEGWISDALAMSRLILDNAYSYEYAAQVVDYAGDQQMVKPASIVQHSYRLRKTRDWLTDSEAVELRELLGKFWAVKDDLPERVDHAIWLAEYVVNVRWLDVIAPLLVVAFEALSGTSSDLVTRQFRERVAAMTSEVGAPLTDRECRDMYSSRSRFVHGERVSLYERKGKEWKGPTDQQQEATLERIAKTQDSLRAVLRRCIEDDEFREIFTDSESIRERWPVTV